jgi:hypothetical protein
MADLSRASLPEEFFDITSAQLLKTPEPQYLHAMLAKGALGIELGVPNAIGFMAGRTAGSEGAEYASVNDGRLFLSDPIMSEAIVAVAGLGSAPGHTIRMNRPRFTDSTYTEASREISASTDISTTAISPESEQAAITVKQYAGPYSSGVKPYAINAFDAQMSIHKLAGIVGLHLKRDFDKWLDTVVVTLMDLVQSGNTLWPTGMTADNDSAVAGDFPMDVNLLFRGEQKLDELNIPVFGNGRRICCVTPQQSRQLKDDSQFARYVQFHKDVNPMYTTYIGSVGRLDLHVSNTLNQAVNSGSVAIHKAHAFGPGKVGMGAARLPRVLYSTADNYGLSQKLIWEYEGGFANLDSRFAVKMHTS